jgi:precorrin-8X/cobalt-precorrin-8 methylmutase
MFDTYAMVDWSAAGVPRTGRDSIWICWVAPDGERLKNPATRHEAKALLEDWLVAARLNRERVLVGFDFPFGYPAGFAARLGLAGSPWRAVWDEIARLIEDDAHNRNNRFAVAAAFNRRVSSASFPFWGCPANRAGPHLAVTRPVYEAKGLAERRLIDRHEYMSGAQPCWKLAYTGSVGSQSLTGIPIVRALRDDPRWAGAALIWPFETGLRPPDDPGVVFAEVYPSLWKKRIPPLDGKPKDAAQVRFVAQFFSARDRAADLACLFLGNPDLSPEERRLIETEEAWTLGVTKPK